jgi:spore coat protein U-like protein
VKWIKWILVFSIMTGSVDALAQQCTVSSEAVSFGTYDPTSGNPLNAIGSISVKCTPETLSVVKLDPGRNSGGGFGQRKMQKDGNYLNYNLYTDAACTKIWGDGTSNTFTQTGSSNVVVYGKIPAMQKVTPGVYNDSVTIIVEW